MLEVEIILLALSWIGSASGYRLPVMLGILSGVFNLGNSPQNNFGIIIFAYCQDYGKPIELLACGAQFAARCKQEGLTMAMHKTTYQSRYKTVCVVAWNQFGKASLYVSENRERFANWYVGRKPAREWPLSRLDELVEKAATIAPVYNGYAQVQTPHEGCY